MDISKLVPTKGHSIIRVDEKPKEASGIILAGSESNSAPVIGTIIAASESSQFKEGTKVVFRKYAIDTLTWINEEAIEETLYILNNEEILAFVSEKDEKIEKTQIEQRKEQHEKKEI